MNILKYLYDIKDSKGCGFLTLLDPDKFPSNELIDIAELCSDNGADAILVGSSFLLNNEFDYMIEHIKKQISIPLILFPGNSNQVSKFADAVLFLSLISGRNPEYLIGQHIRAAPILKNYNIEIIPTGYILIETGKLTSVEYISNTKPIPKDKNDIAMATALAGEYLGMKLIYLEGGSGALFPVSCNIIESIYNYITIPIIVGGGITTPKLAEERVIAGTSFIVIGNSLENKCNKSLIKEFASAIHYKQK